VNLWLVIPAWKRENVTRLCLAQKQDLCRELAPRGITASVVVVADDGNLDVADEYGFDSIRQNNTLGLKINDGFEYACHRGADYVAFCGSDDWIHTDLCERILAARGRVLSGDLIAVVDCPRGKLRHLGVRSHDGVSPWFIPRTVLEQCSFRPAEDERTAGMEGSIRKSLPETLAWDFYDPHKLCRVDFKTGVNMTAYAGVSKLLGYGTEEDAWETLATKYPQPLVEMARDVAAGKNLAPPKRKKGVPYADRHEGKSIWFVVPANGRLDVSRACLTQLSATCTELTARGYPASAVVIADDANLDIAAELGFGTVERQNRPLGRKWNDGYQLAGRVGVDYVIPFGTDDFVTADFITGYLPSEREVRCSRLSSVVREDGQQIAPLRIHYDGGDGIRIWPTGLLKPLNYRPIEEDRDRAMDTSMLKQIQSHSHLTMRYFDIDPWQIVDWKTDGTQLNDYTSCLEFQHGELRATWKTLHGVYPAAALKAMRALYSNGKEHG
jgi:hypothetical protein